MIKFIGKAVVLTLTLGFSLSMGACSMLGTFNKTTANTVCERLNEKYNEEFEAEYIGNRIDTNSATLYVHPKDTPKLMFTAVIDNDGNVTDDYVSNIMTYKVQNDIVESFNKYNIDCAVDVEIVTDIKPEINTNLSIEEFVKKHNVSGMYVKAIYCDDNISKEQLVTIFENISKSYSFKLVINGYFFDIENYRQCSQKFDTYPSYGDTLIKRYNPYKTFTLCVSKEESTPSLHEFEYITEVK